MYNITAKW